MQLILAALFMANLCLARTLGSPQFFFYLILVLCFVSNPLLTNTLYPLTSANVIFCIYTYLFFTLLISILPKQLNKRDLYLSTNKIELLTNILVPLFAVFLLINTVIVLRVVSFVYLNEINITTFKNESGASTFLSSAVNPSLLALSRLMSSMAWISLYMMPICLASGMKRNFFLFFLCSLNVPMISLMGLSRSGIVYYIFSLFVMLIYSKKLISDRAYTQTKLTLYVLISVAAVFFVIITIARFEGYDYWWIYANSGSNLDVVSFSVIYYFTGWIDNSFELIRNKNFSLYQAAPGYLSLPYYLLNLLGFSDFNKAELWSSELGHYSTLFVGLPIDLLVDTGYFGAGLFMLSLVLIKLLSLTGRYDNYKIIFIVYIAQYFSLFYAGNIFSYFFVSLSVLCMIVFHVFYMRVIAK